MKRLGRIWPEVDAFDSLLLAFRKAQRQARHAGGGEFRIGPRNRAARPAA